MEWSWLADAVLLIHAAYVAFVVIGFAAIVAGAALGWRWVRNFWLRIVHLAAIVLVMAEALAGVNCPLTTLEDRLRTAAGEAGYSAGFIAHWVQPLIFFDFPQWVFTISYIAFAAAVAAIFWLARPDPPRHNILRAAQVQHH
jgi:hypothetical protein